MNYYLTAERDIEFLKLKNHISVSSLACSCIKDTLVSNLIVFSALDNLWNLYETKQIVSDCTECRNGSYYLKTAGLACFSVLNCNFTFVFELALKGSVILVLPVYSPPARWAQCYDQMGWELSDNFGPPVSGEGGSCRSNSSCCCCCTWRMPCRRSSSGHRSEHAWLQCLHRSDRRSCCPLLLLRQQ